MFSSSRVASRVSGPPARRRRDPSTRASASDASSPSSSRKIRGAKRGDNERRDEWADALRALTRDGVALRDPPAVLHDVCVVFCEPKTASNVGAFARACAAFECCDLRLVAPSCDVGSRAALSAAKGAQWLVRDATVTTTLEEALVGCSRTVAFHPWEDDAAASRRWFRSVEAAVEAAPGGDGDGKLALVFGNEADGLTAADLDACECVCSLPMGRLVESLSVTHAGVIALSTYFSKREARERLSRARSE